jgi:hypothetical protein
MLSSNKTRQGYARKRILKPAGYFFLAQCPAFAYNFIRQHPPRLSTMRTMGGYFFLGAEK